MDAILSYKANKEDDFYALLGCDELSSTEQILAEYKIRAKALHPDKNENIEGDIKFTHIQRAKEVLSNPNLRAQYDQWRRSGIAMSFNEWMAKKDIVRMSMHWASQKAKQPMLKEATESEGIEEDRNPPTGRPNQKMDTSAIKDLFRSYQI